MAITIGRSPQSDLLKEHENLKQSSTHNILFVVLGGKAQLYRPPLLLVGGEA